MADSQTEVVPKGNISQMDVDIDKQRVLDAKNASEQTTKDKLASLNKTAEDKKKQLAEKKARKRIPFLKRLFARKKGPMGVTDISKRPIRLNISIEVVKSLAIIAESIIMGFLLNIFFFNFGFRFTILSAIGWGIGFWAIKYRLPEIFRSYR